MFAPDRPAFWWHSLKAEAFGRAGTLIDSSFRVTEDGLYAEALIFEGDVGDRVLRAVENGDAAWSSGTLPHLMKVRSSGYVERWPLVEGSIAPRDAVVSQPRATTVYHVRAVMPGSEKVSDALEDTLALKRSEWIMPPEQNGQVPETPATNGAETAAEIRALTDAVSSLVQIQANAPTRSLPPGGEQFLGDGAAPRISVSHKYDGLSLMGMLCLDQARGMNAYRKNRNYVREEDFMRALTDKVRAVHEAEQRTEVVDAENGLRAIDEEALDAWHAKVPHLRASEAMQSTLAGSGDELVPTLFNSAAHYAFRVESRVYGLLDAFKMPSNPYEWPTISGGPTIRKVNEATDQSQANLASSNRPASKPTTAKITFNALAEGIGALALVSSVLFDDAGLDVAEVLATQFTRNMADAIDAVLLNGDENATATNLGHYGADPTGTAYDKILILNGLRYIANANSDTVDLAGTLTIDKLTSVQQLMGARGVIGTDLANLVLFVDPGVYYKLKTLSEFRTRDKVGETMMTLAQGFVGMWDAIPVILSDQMEYMTADTLRIPSTHNVTSGDAGGMVLMHRKLNKVGLMRDITMEAGPVPHTGLFAMSGTVRLDLQSMEAGSVAHGYGVTI